MQKSLLKIFERVFTVLALLHLTQGFLPLLLTGGFSEGDSLTGGPSMSSFDLSVVRNLTYLIYLVTLVLLCLRWKKVILIFQRDSYNWVFIVFIFCSFLWSELPKDSLPACTTALGASIFGFYLATRYTLEEQLELISWSYVLIVVLSLLFVVALPQYGIMSGIHKGAIRGIYTHKNIFGQAMIIGTMVFLIRAHAKQKLFGSNWMLWLFFGTSFTLVLLSRSSTAAGNVLIVVFLFFVYRTFRWRYEILIPTTLAGILIGFISFILITNNAEAFLISIGKDPTLTGRTDLWSLVWDKIQEKPWLGYGIEGFWTGLDGPSQYVVLGVKTKVVYSHNGFLDMWLTIGIVGIVFFSICFLLNAFKAFSWIRQSRASEALWPLLYLTYLLLANLTESPLLLFNSIIWVMYVMVSFSLLLPRQQQLGLTTARA
ncbi:MAG: O-antigen ligase family protein [Xenococcaceae cyanobacterium]